MNGDYLLTQPNDTRINDISDIVDTDSFIEFLRIAYETNPMEMAAGAILILVVGIYINKKTSSFIAMHVRKYVENRFRKKEVI